MHVSRRSAVVLPVPGAPRTHSRPSWWSTTCCCAAVSSIVRTLQAARDSYAQACLRSSTSFSTAGRSVMIPSTPRSSSRVHLVGVVDRPHVDLQAPAVGGVDEAPVDQRHAALVACGTWAHGARRSGRTGTP